MHNRNVVEVPIIHSYNVVDLALFLKLLGVYISSDLRWNYHIEGLKVPILIANINPLTPKNDLHLISPYHTPLNQTLRSGE